MSSTVDIGKYQSGELCSVAVDALFLKLFPNSEEMNIVQS